MSKPASNSIQAGLESPRARAEIGATRESVGGFVMIDTIRRKFSMPTNSYQHRRFRVLSLGDRDAQSFAPDASAGDL